MEVDTKAFNGWLHKLFPVAALIVFVAALWALHREISHFKFSEFRVYIHKLSVLQLSIAIVGTIAGYFALIGYDCFAMRYVQRRLSYRRIALTSFVGYAFSMNIGQSVLSGGAVRMRLYSSWGLGAGEITRIIGFNIVVGFIGQLLAGGILFSFGDFTPPGTVQLPFQSFRGLGIVLLLGVAGFFILIGMKRSAIQIRNWKFELPPLRIAVPAITLATIDWLLAGTVLYFLMPQDAGLGIWHFLGIVLISQTFGLISMVPGGLGVFETAMIHLLPDSIPNSTALSALIAYRVIYYLVPFILAILLLGGHEIATRKQRLASASAKVVGWLSPLVPVLMSVMVFAAGVIILLSGATPAIGSRIEWLEKWLPLAVVELSHFLGSIVGVTLILLSSAIRRRIDAAWLLTVILLLCGIAASLLKGFDYEEAILLALMMMILILCRSRFHRHASLFSMRFTPTWWLAVGMVIATVAWIGFASYERIHYNSELWSQIRFKGDASRFLRASAAIAGLLGAVGFWQLLRPGAKVTPLDSIPDETGRALPIVRASEDTKAYLALLGDKRFLFSESGQSFIMYGIQGRTWIAMGDVVGNPEEEEALAWAFREACDMAGARPSFYQVSADSAHTYSSLGLLLYKLGEEARIDLQNFSLEGSARKDLRHTKSKIERGGAIFEIVPSSRFEEIKEELRSISDEWLSEKNAGEKGFSLGSFHDDYLRHFDYAVIKVEGRIVAFANICTGAGKHELSIDLMRHTVGSPYGAMEYLFIELMLWGKEQEYSWFSLGMAPLSGLENRTLAPVWTRIGAQIFTLGEHFYNFKGLRSYKEKFDPVWESRYLACRGIVQLPVVLLDIASHISGGLSKSLAGNTDKSDTKDSGK